MASSFKKIVECTNVTLDKLANGLYINLETKLVKKVVDELTSMEIWMRRMSSRRLVGVFSVSIGVRIKKPKPSPN